MLSCFLFIPLLHAYHFYHPLPSLLCLPLFLSFMRLMFSPVSAILIHITSNLCNLLVHTFPSTSPTLCSCPHTSSCPCFINSYMFSSLVFPSSSFRSLQPPAPPVHPVHMHTSPPSTSVSWHRTLTPHPPCPSRDPYT